MLCKPDHKMHCLLAWCGLAGSICVAAAPSVQAQTQRDVRLENKTAIFSALDKVTARISKIEIPLNETRQFGSLKVTPRVCYTRPPTLRPKTTSFVEVTEVQLDGAETKLFSGWMFAQSPGLNAVEHPVFDVWLTDCGGRPKPTTTTTAAALNNGKVGELQNREARPRRVRRRRRIRR